MGVELTIVLALTLFTGIVGPKIKLRITLIGSDVDVVLIVGS